MAEWERLVVRALSSQETELTVVRREELSPTYVRIQVTDGGLLARRPPFPTMWLRLWFDDHSISGIEQAEPVVSKRELAQAAKDADKHRQALREEARRSLAIAQRESEQQRLSREEA